MVHKGNHPFSCLKKLTFHTDELFMQTVSQAYRYVNPRSQTLLTQQRPSGPRGVCSLVANHVLGQSPRRVSHLEFNIGVGRPEHLALEFRPIMVLVNVAADLGMKLVWPSDRAEVMYRWRRLCCSGVPFELSCNRKRWLVPSVKHTRRQRNTPLRLNPERSSCSPGIAEMFAKLFVSRAMSSIHPSRPEAAAVPAPIRNVFLLFLCPLSRLCSKRLSPDSSLNDRGARFTVNLQDL